MNSEKLKFRKDKIIKIFNKEINLKFPEIQNAVYSAYEFKEQEILNNFICSFNNIINEFKEDNEQIRYIDISFLFSSFVCKEYDLQLTGYNSLYYVDIRNRHSKINYRDVMNSYSGFFDEIINEIKKENTLIKDFEIYELNTNFSIIYFAFLQNILIDLLEKKEIYDLFKEKKDMFHNSVYIKYGSYLDENSRIIKELNF